MLLGRSTHNDCTAPLRAGLIWYPNETGWVRCSFCHVQIRLPYQVLHMRPRVQTNPVRVFSFYIYLHRREMRALRHMHGNAAAKLSHFTPGAPGSYLFSEWFGWTIYRFSNQISDWQNCYYIYQDQNFHLRRTKELLQCFFYMKK